MPEGKIIVKKLHKYLDITEIYYLKTLICYQGGKNGKI